MPFYEVHTKPRSSVGESVVIEADSPQSAVAAATILATVITCEELQPVSGEAYFSAAEQEWKNVE